MPISFLATLSIRDRGDKLSAICHEVPGLHLYGATTAEIQAASAPLIVDLMKRNRGLDVTVTAMREPTRLMVEEE